MLQLTGNSLQVLVVGPDIDLEPREREDRENEREIVRGQERG